MQKQFGDATAQLPSDGFRLCPLLLNGIEIRTVGREVLERVSLAGDGFSHVLSFMKCGIVHDDDGGGWSLREQILDEPCTEHIGVDRGIEETDRQERMPKKGSNRILPATGMPVFQAVTAHSSRGISVRSRSIKGKPALVEIHNGAPLDVLVPPYPRLEAHTMNGISLGMKQSFF